jgi:hypothetical protein
MSMCEPRSAPRPGGNELSIRLIETVPDEAVSQRPGRPVDNTVFVFAPEHRQDQLRPLLEAFICWPCSRTSARSVTAMAARPARLAPTSTDRELLELLTVLIGKEEITQASLTYGVDGSRVATASICQRELAPIHSLVQQRPGQALALLSHRRPVQLRVRPYPELREFREVPEKPEPGRLRIGA